MGTSGGMVSSLVLPEPTKGCTGWRKANGVGVLDRPVYFQECIQLCGMQIEVVKKKGQKR
jgi:hypothetical protein